MLDRSTRIRRHVWSAAILTTMLVGACTRLPTGADLAPTPGAAATTPSLSASVDAVSSPSPQTTPSPTPNVTRTDPPRPSGPASPSVYPHVDAALEALLPDRIGDTPLIRMSAPGSAFDHGGDVCSLVCPREARVMAESVSASVADVTLAFAYDEGLDDYALVAFRVDGASGADLLAARLALTASEAEAPYPMVAEKRVGDDRITVAIRSWFPNDTEFLLARDDALIVIKFRTPEHDGAEPTLPEGVARIVAALP